MGEQIFDSLLNKTMKAETTYPEKVNEVVVEGPDNKNLKNRPEKKDDDKLGEDDLVKEGLEEELPEEEFVEKDLSNPYQSQNRMEGLVDIKAMDDAEVALTQAAESLLGENFDVEDIISFLSGAAQKAVANAEANKDIDKVTPGGEEECVQPRR